MLSREGGARLTARTDSRLASAAVLAAIISISMACTGSGDRNVVSELPGTVFEGGGGELKLQVDVNQPSRLSATFARYDDEGEDERRIDVVEDIQPGAHALSVDVSPDTYVYLELGVPAASVGAELNWVVTLDGREVQRENDRLAEPLESGYAFFLQLEADDVDQIESWIR